MQHAVISVVVLVAIIGCQGCNEDHSAGPRDNSVESVASCADIVDQPVRLASGVVLTCVRDSAGFLATLWCGDESVQLLIERGASFHGFGACPGIVAVVDCYASNEDRLIFLVFGKGEPQRRFVEHDYGDRYIHNHFSVEGVDGSGIRIKEWQYAGHTPPRERHITVSITGPERRLERRCTPWSADREFVSDN